MNARPIFPVGTRVSHPEYGDGVVVSAAGPTNCAVQFDERKPYRKDSIVEFVGVTQDDLTEAPAAWGELIRCDGVRPTWLRDDDRIRWFQRGGTSPNWPLGNLRHILAWKAESANWKYARFIRLPADHPYYLATSQGFEYWPGGDAAPEDWDGTRVLFRSAGVSGYASNWRHVPAVDRSKPGFDIIGYHKRANPQPAAEPATPTPHQREIAALVAENDRLNGRVVWLLHANNRLVEEKRALKAPPWFTVQGETPARKWGAAIHVFGRQPRWVTEGDDLQYQLAGDESERWRLPSRDGAPWSSVKSIRLPRDHSVYGVAL